MVSSAWATKRRSALFNLKSSRGLEKRSNTQPSQLDSELALRTPPHKNDAPVVLVKATES